MPACCVPNCLNRSEKGVRLFVLPRGNEERRQQWIKNINRGNLSRHSSVCEVHFSEDQFENKREDNKRPLRWNAVPTLFMNIKVKKKGKSQNVKRTKVKDNSKLALPEQKQINRENCSSVHKETCATNNTVTCRTCLNQVTKENSSAIKKLYYGKTLRKMITMCVPQMAATLSDNDYICNNKCFKVIRQFCEFIENCLQVEAKIREGKVAIESSNDSSPKENIKYEPVESIESRVEYEHNYIVLGDNDKNNKNYQEFKEGTTCRSDDSEVKIIKLLDQNGELASVDLLNAKNIEFMILPETEINYLDGNSFSCNKCHNSNTGSLREHMEKFHKDESNLMIKKMVYNCETCGLKFTNCKDMLTHRKRHEFPLNLSEEILDERIAPQIAPQKLKKLEEKKSVEQDLAKQNTDNVKKRKPPPRFLCDMCPMIFRYIARLKEHKDIVHFKIKAYECADCGKKFGSKSNLKSHHNVHKIRKIFMCEICGSNFKRRNYLKVHKMNYHVRTSLLRKTYSKLDMSRAEDQLYPCTFCGLFFKTVDNLKRHLILHARIRKFKCGFCELRFLHQRTRRLHERTHSMDPNKKFVSQICWKRMSTKEEFNSHCRKFNNRQKRHKCEICSKMFPRKSLLENHFHEVHTTEEDISRTEEEINQLFCNVDAVEICVDELES